MAQLDMLNFVSEHAGQLLGSARQVDESAVDDDHAARQCERIHRAVFGDVKLIGVLRTLRQACADGAHRVVGRAGVLECEPGTHPFKGLAADPHLLLDSNRAGNPTRDAIGIEDEEQE